MGRFISPDRLVQSPGNPQTLNRYAYCLNNPLIYTDPSGEFIGLIIAIVMGSFVGAIQAHNAGENPLKGAMLGAIIGATSYMVGNVVGTVVGELLAPTVQTAINAGANGAVAAAHVVTAMAGGFAGGAVAGALNAAAYGGSVWKGALYGGLAAAAIAGTIQGAIELNKWVNASPKIEAPTNPELKVNRSPSRECPITPEQQRLADWVYDLSLNGPGGCREYIVFYNENGEVTGYRAVGVRGGDLPQMPPEGSTGSVHTHQLCPDDLAKGRDVYANPSPRDFDMASSPGYNQLDHYIKDYRGMIRFSADDYYYCPGYRE